MKTKFSPKHYGSPTPKKWRMIGDFCLVLLPTIQVGLANAPSISDNTKYWIGFISTILLVAAKFYTNMYKQDPIPTQPIGDIRETHTNA